MGGSERGQVCDWCRRLGQINQHNGRIPGTSPSPPVRSRIRVGLLSSDTHGFLDEALFHDFAECDEIRHVGDVGTIELLDCLKTFKPVRGVYGNVDVAERRANLPQDLVCDREGLPVYIPHMGGYPARYDPRAGKELRRIRPDLLISGHSHALKGMRDSALGVLHMNPGACGHHGWQLVRTALRFTVEAGEISGVQAIELGPRGGDDCAPRPYRLEHREHAPPSLTCVSSPFAVPAL